MYLQACAYEEKLQQDEVCSSFLKADLDILKKRLWECHMREENPASPSSNLTELKGVVSWEIAEYVQIALGYCILLALLISPACIIASA